MQYISTPHEAELNAERVLKSWGYIDAVATTGGADGGIDVRSSKVLAQVKFRGSKAGRPELQNLVGARQGEPDKTLMFFDYMGYSRDAVVYADAAGIGLYVYDLSGNVEPVNEAGRRLMAATLWARFTTALMSPRFQLWALLALGIVLACVLITLVLSDGTRHRDSASKQTWRNYPRLSSNV